MIQFKNVSKNYFNGQNNEILKEINFKISDGEFILLVGRSGCGKTTIFKLMTRIEEETSGSIIIDDIDITQLREREIPKLRQQIGFIFQDYKLISSKNVFENIALALEVVGKSNSEIKERVTKLLKIVSLEGKENVLPSQLSGGEKQKVAIARAIALDPTILLADEPTGNLDPVSTVEIINIIREINKSGTTVIMATHDTQLIEGLGFRIIEIDNGKIVENVEKKYFEDYKNKFGSRLKNIKVERTPKAVVNHQKPIDPEPEIFPNIQNIKSVSHEVPSNKKPVTEHKRIEKPSLGSRFANLFRKNNVDNTAIKPKDVEKPEPKVIVEKEAIDFQNKFFSVSDDTIDNDKRNKSENNTLNYLEEKSVSRKTIEKLYESGIYTEKEIKELSDLRLSKIVGISNVWKIRQAIK